MSSHCQTAQLDTIPTLPPLSFQRSPIGSLPQTPVISPKPLPRDFAPTAVHSLAPAMESESSIPPMPELLYARSSTDSSQTSLPPTPRHTVLDLPEPTAASPTISVSQPANALGLSQRRDFKGEHLDLKTKRKGSTSSSTLSPRTAFLSPFLSPSLTPRTSSILERMSSFVNHAPSPSFSADHSNSTSVATKIANMRTEQSLSDWDSDPFKTRDEKDRDPRPIPSFWSDESQSSSTSPNLYDFGAYIVPSPQSITTTKLARRFSSTLRWPPVGSQTLVHQFSVPVRCTINHRPPSPVDDKKLREQKRERRATQIHSARLFTSSSIAASYVREGPQSVGYLRESPPPLPSPRLLSANLNVLSQKLSIDAVPEKNQARQIGALIDLMSEGVDDSDISFDSVYLPLVPDILHAL
ncbi:hypothetical protein PENSPDRAFT_172092 [Peniophora sp. CONT]|nr:hypothetical protein PENSPDRAFT_172092 [Peniophora sp. CONT]